MAPATKPTIAVKRFWVVSDERGLPHRLLDEQGAEFWKATWDASGWRTIQTQAAEMLWVPFGLPGQLVLRDTDAYASGTESGATVTRYRAPIILNQWRAYDALTGTYLQPDGADVIGRLSPEGYVYAFSSPITVTDVSGGRGRGDLLRGAVPDYWQRNFDPSCDAMKPALLNAINDAIDEIRDCRFGDCGKGDGSLNFRRQWLMAMMTGNFLCATKGHPVQVPYSGTDGSEGTDTVAVDYLGHLQGAQSRFGFTRPGANSQLYDRYTVLGENFDGGKKETCLARVVAHEAAHAVYLTLPNYFLKHLGTAEQQNKTYFFKFGNPYSIEALRDAEAKESNDRYRKVDSHGDIEVIEDCVKCKK
ncbi:MAG TPA: hypothetical protein PLF40_19080 [Kofleriaceae bacterium]|nr:hypothetical protein [Kofleriaceae bacterium]